MKLKQERHIAYDTAGIMPHKIRRAMGERNSLYMLSGTVKVNDAFFGGAHAGGKRGRGTNKTPVIWGLSLDQIDRPQYQCVQVCDHINRKILIQFEQKILFRITIYYNSYQ